MPFSSHYYSGRKLLYLRINGPTDVDQNLKNGAAFVASKEFQEAERVLIDITDFRLNFDQFGVERIARGGVLPKAIGHRKLAFVCPSGVKRGIMVLYLKLTGLQAGLFTDIPAARAWLEDGAEQKPIEPLRNAALLFLALDCLRNSETAISTLLEVLN